MNKLIIFSIFILINLVSINGKHYDTRQLRLTDGIGIDIDMGWFVAAQDIKVEFDSFNLHYYLSDLDGNGIEDLIVTFGRFIFALNIDTNQNSYLAHEFDVDVDDYISGHFVDKNKETGCIVKDRYKWISCFNVVRKQLSGNEKKTLLVDSINKVELIEGQLKKSFIHDAKQFWAVGDLDGSGTEGILSHTTADGWFYRKYISGTGFEETSTYKLDKLNAKLGSLYRKEHDELIGPVTDPTATVKHIRLGHISSTKHDDLIIVTQDHQIYHVVCGGNEASEPKILNKLADKVRDYHQIYLAKLGHKLGLHEIVIDDGNSLHAYTTQGVETAFKLDNVLDHSKNFAPYKTRKIFFGDFKQQIFGANNEKDDVMIPGNSLKLEATAMKIMYSQGNTMKFALINKSPIPWLDQDEDGIKTFYEMGGKLDLPLHEYGSSPFSPDIFFEIDAQPGVVVSQAMEDAIVDELKDHGMNVHLKQDPTPLPAGIIKKGVANWPEKHLATLTPSRKGFFRHCILIADGKLHRSDNKKIAGTAIFGGEQLFVTITGDLGFDANTYLHELGHNFGLGHVNQRNVNSKLPERAPEKYNYKPNSISIMNYLFARNIQRDGVKAYSYSEIVCDAIDEAAVKEKKTVKCGDYKKSETKTISGSKYQTIIKSMKNKKIMVNSDNDLDGNGKTEGTHKLSTTDSTGITEVAGKWTFPALAAAKYKKLPASINEYTLMNLAFKNMEKVNDDIIVDQFTKWWQEGSFIERSEKLGSASKSVFDIKSIFPQLKFGGDGQETAIEAPIEEYFDESKLEKDNLSLRKSNQVKRLLSTGDAVKAAWKASPFIVNMDVYSDVDRSPRIGFLEDTSTQSLLTNNNFKKRLQRK